MDTQVSPALLYLKRKFPKVPALQVLAKTNIERVGPLGVRIVSADTFLAELEV